MRLLIHSHAYPDFLSGIYAAHRDLATRPYDEQFAVIDRQSHVWANAAWAEALRPLGHDVMVIVSNGEQLQKAWASERGIRYAAASWPTEIAEAQIASFQPDLVFVTSYGAIPPGWIEHLRETCATVRRFVVWCGMPFPSVDVFRPFDLVLTCIPETRDYLTSLGCRCRHLNHAFDARVLERIEVGREQDISFGFVGQLIRRPGFHEERVRQLERIARTMDITVFSPTPDIGPVPSRVPSSAGRRRLLRMLRGLGRRNATDGEERLRASIRPGVFGLAMYQVLQRTRVTYNSHIDVSPRSASNRRLFESTGVGSCLLTDDKANLASLFERGREVVTFSTTEECIEKARWLLDHPGEREEIARAGQRRTLQHHTLTRRAPHLAALLREALLA